MTTNAKAQEQLTKLLNGWDAHAEFAQSAESARHAYKHIIGGDAFPTNIRKHEAVNQEHLRRIFLEAKKTYPDFAATLAWLLWFKVAEFDRLELLTKIEETEDEQGEA
jgi:hypothetical protein